MSETQDDETGTDQVTGAPADVDNVKTEAEANEAAISGEGDSTVTDPEQVQDAGYFGTSPAREMTGLEDKGLSQQSMGLTQKAAKPVSQALDRKDRVETDAEGYAKAPESTDPETEKDES